MAALIIVPSRTVLQDHPPVGGGFTDPSELPPAPTRPKLIRITNGTGTLMWQAGTLSKERRFHEKMVTLDYTIEVSIEGGPWKIAASHIPSTTYTAHLTPGKGHVFVVRARGSHGHSPPSPWSPLTVGGESRAEKDAPFEGSSVNLTSVLTSTSRSIKITWKVRPTDRCRNGMEKKDGESALGIKLKI